MRSRTTWRRIAPISELNDPAFMINRRTALGRNCRNSSIATHIDRITPAQIRTRTSSSRRIARIATRRMSPRTALARIRRRERLQAPNRWAIASMHFEMTQTTTISRCTRLRRQGQPSTTSSRRRLTTVRMPEGVARGAGSEVRQEARRPEEKSCVLPVTPQRPHPGLSLAFAQALTTTVATISSRFWWTLKPPRRSRLGTAFRTIRRCRQPHLGHPRQRERRGVGRDGPEEGRRRVHDQTRIRNNFTIGIHESCY